MFTTDFKVVYLLVEVQIFLWNEKGNRHLNAVNERKIYGLLYSCRLILKDFFFHLLLGWGFFSRIGIWTQVDRWIKWLEEYT